MKIRMTRNTRRGTTSIRFSAQNSHEGVALKDAVLALGKESVDASTPVRIIEELAKSGVAKEDFDLKITTPKAAKKATKKEAGAATGVELK